MILKLKDGVTLKSALICEPEGEVAIISSYGRILRLEVNNESMPLMGKLAQGPVTMKVFPEELIVGAISTSKRESNYLVMITRNGKVKKIELNSIRKCQKGNLGEFIVLDNSEENIDRVVDIYNGKSMLNIITNQDRSARICSKELDQLSINEIKTDFIDLKENEYIDKIITLIDPGI